ncbi:hypothetical protein GCM10010297_21450 [Streptomyces malachitofuscus]|nr:hypothetical protein GCM10010297_21450 [Streptomyces malachitofuscus]
MHDDTENGEAPLEADEPYDEAVVASDVNPDVHLDVPVLKVDEIDLDVEDLRAHVSLQAEVLDLLRLNVGADVALGRVHLGISGVEAQARLDVRLDNVAAIIDRVLTTLDRNPEILHELARGVGSAVRDVGGGARQAVGELGTGAGRAVQDVGQGAGTAVRDVGRGAGRAVEDVGAGAGRTVEDVGSGLGSAAADVGRGAGRAVQDVGGGAGRVVEDVAGEAGPAVVGEAGRAVGDAAGSAAGTAGRVTEAAGDVVPEGGRAVEDAEAATEGTTRRARAVKRSAARGPRGEAAPTRTPTGRRRVRTEDGEPAARPRRRRAAEEGEEPP